jgi:flavin reductase (DIM6/NTAB) family NADH-FMN oxidoreductase RutF
MDMNALTTKLTYGLYTMSVKDSLQGGRPAGFMIDAVCQLSSGDEPVVVFSVMNRNYSKDCIAREGVFNMSVLPDDIDPFVIANFGFQSSKDVAKWENVVHEMRAGLPVIPQAISWTQLRVQDSRVFDTHTAFFCVPVEAEYLNAEKTPLRYADYFTKFKEPAFAAFKAYKDSITGKETI